QRGGTGYDRPGAAPTPRRQHAGGWRDSPAYEKGAGEDWIPVGGLSPDRTVRLREGHAGDVQPASDRRDHPHGPRPPDIISAVSWHHRAARPLCLGRTVPLAR